VLVVSLGCESFDRQRLEEAVRRSGRPVATIVIQEMGGTQPSCAAGQRWVERQLDGLAATPTVSIDYSELTLGTICGGSDSFSGITANPAVGRAFDRFVEAGARVIFEETGELFGCEQHMQNRASTAEVAAAIESAMAKAARYYGLLDHGSFAPGNAAGGLTTIEEKSLGAYAKSGSAPICGVLKPGDVPTDAGTYLLDIVPDGEVRFGFPNINDNAEIAELIACGAQAILFTTGRGSVVGSAIAPVIKICANPMTFRRMGGDMDINAGRIVEDDVSLVEMGAAIFDKVTAVAAGTATCSEALGHQEFVLTYKSFEPPAPGCFPGAAISANAPAAGEPE
jgi:altronate hydrolase